MTDTIRSRRKAASALLIIPAILFALSACAPSAGGGGADSAGGSTTGGGGNENSQFDSLFDYSLAYTECMRGEGIDMPDPKKDGGGMAISVGPDTDMEAMEAAGKKCNAELGDPPPPSAEEKAAADKQMMEWATKAAECYRENGYDMPDPKAGEMPEFPEDAPQELQEQCGGGAGSVTKRMD